MRVYPPWAKPIAKDAIKTQLWQLLHFFSMTKEKIGDLALVHKIYGF